MKRLVIVGASGHGRVILEAATTTPQRPEQPPHMPLGFLDDHATGELHELPILGGRELLSGEFLRTHRFIVAIGDQKRRRELSLMILQNGGELATVIHPSAQISPTASIGRGTAVIAGAVVNADARIGDFCIINTSSSIDHDCVLADGVQISPGVRLAGNVHCGEDAFIGTGAVAIPGMRIGDRAVVGAGAVIVRHIPSDAVAYGNPARVIGQ